MGFLVQVITIFSMVSILIMLVSIGLIGYYDFTAVPHMNGHILQIKDEIQGSFYDLEL